MPNLGPFNAPRPQYRTIDVEALARAKALPEVTRQQGKARLFDNLANLPTSLFNAASQMQEYKSKAASQQAFAIEQQPTELVAPQLVQRFPELKGVPFGKAKEFVMSLRHEKQPSELDINIKQERLKKMQEPKQEKISAKQQEQQQAKIKSLQLIEQSKGLLRQSSSGLIGGVGAKAGAAIGFSEIPAAYAGLKPAVAVQIYRALTGDTRLSDADAAARALPLIPTFTQTRATQERKWSELNLAITGQGPNPLASYIPSEPPGQMQSKQGALKTKKSGLPYYMD